MSPSDDGSPHRWIFNASEQRSDSARGVTVDVLKVAGHLGRTPSALTMDLVEMVAAVHLVDRAERRPRATRSGDSWSRRLHLVMGVREWQWWSAEMVHDQIVDLLRYLTDDDWLIEFAPRIAPERIAECVQFLFASSPGGDVVALFSGGLDSLAGMASDVTHGIRPVALSIESNRRLAKSQRARGFGFLALGAAMAALAKLECVHVYENGIGAINLPYTSAQTGAQGARAMRPETVALATRLFSLCLDRSVTIVNRSQYLTKAEMCAALPSAIHPAVLLTKSCDTAFAYRGSGPSSCGSCTSCLLRRQALAAAGLGHLDLASNYRLDAFAHLPAGETPYSLRAMLSQAARLQRALGGSRSTGAWPRLVRELPDIVRAVDALHTGSGPEPQVAVTDMLRRYVEEWLAIPSPLVAAYLEPCQDAA